MKRTAPLFIMIFLLAGAGSVGTLTGLAARDQAAATPVFSDPVLSSAHLKLMAGGFAPALADIHWIGAVAAAGEKAETDQGAERLYHLLDRVVTLDPHFEPAYQYGALLLSIRAARPDLGNRLLLKARKQFPDNWEYPFYLGFNRFYYQSDFIGAADLFEAAAVQGGAPPFLSALAHRFRDQEHNVDEAKALLRRIIKVSNDPTVRHRLTARLAELEGAG
jgi:tetratricopeptide (TPR) repeat protein